MAEEVVQETFLALWNRAETFDPSVGSLAAWLHTIARNRTVDRLRAAGRRPDLVRCRRGGRDRPATSRCRRARPGAGQRPIVAGAGPSARPRWRGAGELRRRSRRPSPACPRTSGSSSSWPTRGPHADRDRRTARVAARHRQDPAPAGLARLREVSERRRPGIHPLSRAGHVGRVGPLDRGKHTTRWTTTSARGAPAGSGRAGGLERLMAGDTPQAGGFVGHLAAAIVPDRARAAARGRAALRRRRRRRRRPTCASGRSRSWRAGGSRALRRCGGAASARWRLRADRGGAAAVDAGSRRGLPSAERPPWVARSPRRSSCRSSRPSVIIGNRVDEQLAAQDRTITGSRPSRARPWRSPREDDAERVALVAAEGR
jgi:hypothetical protein